MQTIQELQTLWELPAGAPHGVLFVAHGCSHQGSDFWLKSPRCLECLGLPEEVAITRAAVKRGYAVVAVSSYDRESKCWQNRAVAQSEDLQARVGGAGGAAAGGGNGSTRSSWRMPPCAPADVQAAPACRLPAALLCCSGCRPSCGT